jgi:lipoate-protein ligase A
MFIEPDNTITYSLYAPESLVAGLSFAQSYPFLDDWVIGTLTGDLGLAAWYQPLNDIASGQGKIGGAAQKRRARASRARSSTSTRCGGRPACPGRRSSPR